MNAEIHALQRRWSGGYIAEADIATAAFLAGELGKPLLSRAKRA